MKNVRLKALLKIYQTVIAPSQIKKYSLCNRNFICDNKSKISFYMYAYFFVCMYLCICIYIAIFMMFAIIFMNILHKNIPTVIISS